MINNIEVDENFNIKEEAELTKLINDKYLNGIKKIKKIDTPILRNNNLLYECGTVFINDLPTIINSHLYYNKNTLAIYSYSCSDEDSSTIFHPRLSYRKGWLNSLHCIFFNENIMYNSNYSELDEIRNILKYFKNNKLTNNELNLLNLNNFDFFKNKEVGISVKSTTTYKLEEDGFAAISMNNIVNFKNPNSEDLPDKLKIHSIELDENENIFINLIFKVK